MATQMYPPGQTFLHTLKRSFTDVPVKDGAIATTEFLEAAESLTTLFGKFSRLRYGTQIGWKMQFL
jgi:hypothetical protein